MPNPAAESISSESFRPDGASVNRGARLVGPARPSGHDIDYEASSRLTTSMVENGVIFRLVTLVEYPAMTE
jgi:hypothetical protein